MISRKAYEIAEVISKQHGLITLELTCDQVLNWYEHLSDESNQQGNHRLSEENKREIIDLNGLGYDPTWISKKTGHTRMSVSRVLYDADTDNLMSRVKRMQYIESMDGCIIPYDTRPLEDVRTRRQLRENEQLLREIKESRDDFKHGRYKNLRDLIKEQ